MERSFIQEKHVKIVTFRMGSLYTGEKKPKTYGELRVFAFFRKKKIPAGNDFPDIFNIVLFDQRFTLLGTCLEYKR